MGFRAAEATATAEHDDGASRVIERTLLARDIALNAPHDEGFLARLEEVVGSTQECTSSVPAAIGIVLRTGGRPTHSCVLAANLGGETSRIGALATAMAGASQGRRAIPAAMGRRLEKVNSLHLVSLAERLVQIRS